MVPPSRHSDPEPHVELDARAAISVRNGHPWVWRNSIHKAAGSLPCGCVVTVSSRDGTFLGRGLWDTNSPIAVRIHSCNPDRKLDLATMSMAVSRALALRDRLFDLKETNAFRLCNGEGDRIPGLVLDRYDTVAVAKFDGDAIRVWGEDLLEAIWPQLHQRGIKSIAIRESRRDQQAFVPFGGEPCPEMVTVVERNMKMIVDLARGQKTGAFLDQRENRKRIRGMAQGARVLNLFSYTGGFSCAAALGGAANVTSIDIAHPAHATAQETFRLNGVDPSRHTFVTSDVFSFLEQARARNERYHLVISDPPSFAPNERSLPRAINAYRRLHEACAALVARGGILCAASCSSHVTLEGFFGTLDDSVLGDRSFVVLEHFGQPPDHPTVPIWSEGRYLKFVVMQQGVSALPLGMG